MFRKAWLKGGCKEADFWISNFYTNEIRKTPKKGWLPRRVKYAALRVQSGKKFLWTDFLHRHRLWCPWQIWGLQDCCSVVLWCGWNFTVFQLATLVWLLEIPPSLWPTGYLIISSFANWKPTSINSNPNLKESGEWDDKGAVKLVAKLKLFQKLENGACLDKGTWSMRKLFQTKNAIWEGCRTEVGRTWLGWKSAGKLC